MEFQVKLTLPIANKQQKMMTKTTEWNEKSLQNKENIRGNITKRW